MPRGQKSETLKIVVVGTPKTGNTWVKHLLAETYDLPLVRLKPEFDLAEVEAAGPRWISHQHFLPSAELLAWGAAQEVVFVCPVRHPGDVLVSLWHHVRNRPAPEKYSADDYTNSKSMLGDETKIIGQHTRRFVESGFHFYLNLSVAWLGLPGVRAVRYEDLWECPVESLRALTSSILPVPEERLRIGLCACELGLMQNLMDPDRKFLRQGGTGGWRAALPNDIKRLLSSLDPYPAQFAALGYTMDEENPVNAPRPEAAIVVGPFGKNRTFANGIPVAPVLMKAYFDLPHETRGRWSDPRSTSPDSFFNWLNRPAAADPHATAVTPCITELAHYLYRARPDLAKTFPDVFGTHRGAYYGWFLENAINEYDLNRIFVPDGPFAPDSAFDNGIPAPRLLVRLWFDLPASRRLQWPEPRRTGPGSLFAWLVSPAASDPVTENRPAIVSELAAYIYSIRPDIVATFPDIFGRDRLAFVEWFIVNAQKEYGLHDSLVRADPFAGFTHFSNGTRIARVLVRMYLDLPEAMRKRWPQPVSNGEGSFLAWLNSPAAADPSGGVMAPMITELGAYLHSIRPDVRQSWPDLYGKHRVDFTQWFLASAAREYDLDRAFTLPVIRSWAQSVDRVPPHVCKLLRQRQRALHRITH